MSRTVNVLALACCVLAIAAGVGPALAMKIELAPDAARLKDAPGVELANAQCMTCHSVDYVITQPRGKPLAFWRAEVDKMKKVYAAPIPDDQLAPIAQYLAQTYGTAQ